MLLKEEAFSNIFQYCFLKFFPHFSLNYTVLQPDQLNNGRVVKWYLIKSYQRRYWTNRVLQGTRQTRPCSIGHLVGTEPCRNYRGEQKVQLLRGPLTHSLRNTGTDSPLEDLYQSFLRIFGLI